MGIYHTLMALKVTQHGMECLSEVLGNMKEVKTINWNLNHILKQLGRMLIALTHFFDMDESVKVSVRMTLGKSMLNQVLEEDLALEDPPSTHQTLSQLD